MVAIIVLGVIVWLSIPLVLSKAMARRAFDGPSYLLVGLLIGPVAVALARPDVVISEHAIAGGYDFVVLGDVGDSWRALLLGAPPALL